jgi:putative redox protein
MHCARIFFVVVVAGMMSVSKAFYRSNIRAHRRPGRFDVCFSSLSDGAEYVKSYRLNGKGEKSRVEISTDTGHHLATDVPKKMGGSDAAPQPVETLVAAWMGCTQATAIFVGRQMAERVLIQKIEFNNIQAYRDERGALELPIHETPSVPSRLQRITGTIRVFSRTKEGLSDEQIELLKEQTEVRCPVANMIVASGCAMEVEWVDGTRLG